MEKNYLDWNDKSNQDFIYKIIEGNDDNFNIFKTWYSKLEPPESKKIADNKVKMIFDIIVKSYEINKKNNNIIKELQNQVDVNELSSTESLYEKYINSLEIQLKEAKKEIEIYKGQRDLLWNQLNKTNQEQNKFQNTKFEEEKKQKILIKNDNKK